MTNNAVPELKPTQPPKDDPMTPEELSQFDGSDPSKPVYVAVKGVIFDVSPRREMYEKGRGYSVFAGKDASRGLGMSSLNPENAVADYSTLTPEQLKVLEDWFEYYKKVLGIIAADGVQRYNIVGRVVEKK